jgi:hypothetical protein
MHFKELAWNSLSYILTKFVIHRLELQINLLLKYYLISISKNLLVIILCMLLKN